MYCTKMVSGKAEMDCGSIVKMLRGCYTPETKRDVPIDLKPLHEVLCDMMPGECLLKL